MDLAACLADPVRAQALVCWNMNVAASGPRQRQLRQALRREDLVTVAIDLFQTDTADLADVVLPAEDEVLVSNETGSLKLRVRLSDDVPPGVALSYKGRWPRQKAEGANVNALNPGRKTDIGESTCVHGVEVALTRLS